MATKRNQLPEVSYLEGKFWFVKNDVLKTNLAIAFQYIIFLMGLEKQITLPGVVSYSIYKNIIIYTASIVESILHHVLNQQIKSGKIDEKDVMPKEEIYRDKKTLYEIKNSDDKVIGAILTKRAERLKRDTQFQTIIRGCKNANVLDQNLYKQVELLRERRNKVHLAGLENVDNYYDKTTIEEAFSTASKVMKKAEELLGD